MVIINSLRQLKRTPVKTLVFFALLILTIAFFMLGFNLQSIAEKNIQRLEDMFITIGTVEQKATDLEVVGQWDAEKKAYIYRRYPVHGDTVPMTVLDIPGVDYIQQPEQRPVYCAYDPDYVVLTNPRLEAAIKMDTIIVEIQPLEDCETGDPVIVRINKVLMGFPTLENATVWLCNHYEEKTYKLYADKTYIVGLSYRPSHEGADYFEEYTPWGVSQGQTGESAAPWDEVTDTFYETPKGKAWLDYMKAIQESIRHTIPVIPTNYTKLIMAFYNGEAMVTEGRDISDEEYRNGEHVCLISEAFAKKNGLKVGDSLPLPLIWTIYAPSSAVFSSAAGEYGTTFGVNDSDALYTPFDNDVYKIVGTYYSAATASSLYALGGNAVIIPSKSVTNTDESLPAHLLPMRGYSTSFQIPNGTIDEYMAAWEAQGVDDVEITFYDKGYSKIKAGLVDMQNMAALMFTVGAVTTLFTIILFCHLFITKQRRRTAIERSLGLSKARCTLSMLVGVAVIVVPAYVFGCLAGNVLTSLAVPQISASQPEQAFDTTFSDWAIGVDDEAESASISVELGETGGYLASAAVIPLSLMIAFITISGNLKAEPLKLLGEKER